MDKNKFIELKEKHGQEVVFLFRVGEFYEAYREDAERLAKLLGVALTKSYDGELQAMFPCYQLDTNLPKIVRAGHRVALADGTTTNC